jgi:hypothetical protein
MPRLLAAAALVLLVTSCGGSEVATPSAAPAAAPGTSPSSTASPVAPPPTPTGDPDPALPAGVPGSFADDVPGGDLPLRALIPAGTTVTDSWLASTSTGDSVTVAFIEPGRDPFVSAQGFVVWRRQRGSSPPWRPVFGIVHPKDAGILAIQGITGDATGDGSDDVLLFEATGGVGNCGTWRVLDPGAGVQRWHRSLCDARVDVGAEPAGLVLTETVYEPGDPHCCPSAIKVSVLEYREPNRFVPISEEVTPI